MKLAIHFALLGALFVSTSSLAECADADAIESANIAAQDLLAGEVFLPGKVLKKHHPSKRKEVASYIKNINLHYTVFSLVNQDCESKVIKRTHGKY